MKKIWITFISVVSISFIILIWIGTEVYQTQPPIPDTVIVEGTQDILYTKEDIQIGQNVWESIGGMEVGSIWGHGSYVAPDWTADWIHKEATFMLEAWAKNDIKTNTFNEADKSITISESRLAAIKENIKHYTNIFSEGKEEYAIPKGALVDPEKLEQLNAFLFWTSWAASTNRPSKDYTYTSNWPHEPLIDNTITSDSLIWSGLSIVLLLLFIGILTYYYLLNHEKGEILTKPGSDPLTNLKLFKSQKAILKYFI